MIRDTQLILNTVCCLFCASAVLEFCDKGYMPTTFSVMSFTQNAKLWIYFIPLCTMLILLYFAFNSQWNTFSFNGSNQVNLDGCYHVYLDVGTHVGIQVFIEVNQKYFFLYQF